MKRIIAMLLAVMMVFALCACTGDGSGLNNAVKGDTEKKTIDGSKGLSMGTGGPAGTYYAFGGILCQVVGEDLGISMTAVTTGGSGANLESMGAVYQLATVQSDVMTYAFEGTNSFAESGKLDNFRVLCALYAETVQIVTIDPSIKSVADLKGKSVCVGDQGSGTYYNTIDVLAAYGMTLDDINPVYQSFDASTESVQDGKIDAAFLCAGAPTPAVATLASAKNINLISIDDEHMEKLLKDCPYYASYTIPAGTYDGLDVDTQTVTVKATLICSANMTDECAYNIVKSIFDNKDAITALHAKGAELDLTFATEGIAVPFHDGAAKFFSENGIDVKTK